MLVTGLSGTAWIEAAKTIDDPCLRTVVIGALGTLDAYYPWYRIREIGEDGALLVRPDGVVAWRRCAAVESAEDTLVEFRQELSQSLRRAA